MFDLLQSLACLALPIVFAALAWAMLTPGKSRFRVWQEWDDREGGVVILDPDMPNYRKPNVIRYRKEM